MNTLKKLILLYIPWVGLLFILYIAVIPLDTCSEFKKFFFLYYIYFYRHFHAKITQMINSSFRNSYSENTKTLWNGTSTCSFSQLKFNFCWVVCSVCLLSLNLIQKNNFSDCLFLYFITTLRVREEQDAFYSVLNFFFQFRIFRILDFWYFSFS